MSPRGPRYSGHGKRFNSSQLVSIVKMNENNTVTIQPGVASSVFFNSYLRVLKQILDNTVLDSETSTYIIRLYSSWAIMYSLIVIVATTVIKLASSDVRSRVVHTR